ncbi:antibiotic biosynthesis monooxygenase [Fervidicella metallireducens AeB]|uniref:Antibiotic biosynthesis monooxygenase n=1 Tax=Fervidicella metallireducens AeB TaxID=1403537 RepID=A0A017RYH6_9CLOT|nr:putative quinol monooxygenase [Fervidicella metallireducens]EYE89616.1 antibiotic biosynthesis monooxygenase [Fervidicella metallireducens AeB]
MLKVVAKNFADKSKIEEILKLYKELVELTRKEEGCIKYELFQDEKDSSILCMIEEWESRDALDKHLKSEHFSRIVPKIKKFMIKETELNVYNKLM